MKKNTTKQTNKHPPPPQTHTQICIDKHIDMSLVNHTDEVKSISKDGTRCPERDMG